MAQMAESVKKNSKIGLSQAIKSGRLQAFIDQEEKDSVGPIDADAFARAIAKTVKAPRSARRT
jgi:hypothetical protein